jgi:hypothetical protein
MQKEQQQKRGFAETNIVYEKKVHKNYSSTTKTKNDVITNRKQWLQVMCGKQRVDAIRLRQARSELVRIRRS